MVPFGGDYAQCAERFKTPGATAGTAESSSEASAVSDLHHARTAGGACAAHSVADRQKLEPIYQLAAGHSTASGTEPRLTEPKKSTSQTLRQRQCLPRVPEQRRNRKPQQFLGIHKRNCDATGHPRQANRTGALVFVVGESLRTDHGQDRRTGMKKISSIGTLAAHVSA